MAIQFTRNHSDHSTDKGFQFEFFCDRCGNGFMSAFKPSVAGLATGALRVVGDIFGGILGQASRGSYEVERAVRGPAHDKALRDAVEEIKVNFEEGVLTISGEKKREIEKKEHDNYYHFERSYGRFSRSFTLPAHVDSQNVEARYTNGVLELKLRKTEKSRPKAIEVKVE